MLCFGCPWAYVLICYPSVHLHSIIINKLAAVNPEFIPYGQIKGPCMIKMLRLEDFRFLGKPAHLCKTDNIQVNQSEFQSKMSLFSERFCQFDNLDSFAEELGSQLLGQQGKLCDFEMCHSALQLRGELVL